MVYFIDRFIFTNKKFIMKYNLVIEYNVIDCG